MTRPRTAFALIAAALLVAGCAGATSGHATAKTLHPVADDCIGCWNNR